MVESTSYPGGELELFARATNWKRTIRRQIAPFLGDEVLEVGAGFGATTLALQDRPRRRWLCLEPDPLLGRRLATRIESGELPAWCSLRHGTVGDLESDELFETILYIDVLEHIEDHVAELATAAGRLRTGGHLVVLSPAHGWLYSPFDRSIGHHRRYSRAALAAAAPAALERVRLRYLDSVGLLASLGNKLLLRQALPTTRQIAVWDSGLVPLSRLIDPLTGYTLGKSVLGVFRRTS
jgi:2-polyprenyl-3-methyl-5-hydroxy-6-metoxy-1,4-benzoquinol methylase